MAGRARPKAAKARKRARRESSGTRRGAAPEAGGASELEAALEAAEMERRRLQALMDSLPVAVAITDVQGGTVRSNRAFDELWSGPRPPARTVRDYAAYRAWWVDSGEPLAPDEWASARAVEKGETVVGQVLEIERFDGTRAFVINSASPIRDASGVIVGSAVALQDITALRNAEQALRDSEGIYRAIGESIDFGVWVCAPDGRNVYASESFLDLVGMTQQQCSDFGWGEVLHPDDAERTIAAWKECVRTGGAWDIEHRFKGVDGAWHDVLARGVPIRNERGEVVCWAGINLDIGRLKKTEAALRDSEARLIEMDRRKTEFLAMLSHELRNPLAPIRNGLYVLERAEPGSEQARRAKDVVGRQVAQLSRLVNDLLDATRVATNKIVLAREPVDLCSLAQRVAEDHRSLFEGCRVRLEVDVAPEALWVDGDSIRLEQVLGNLLQNAVKFTPAGGSTRLSVAAAADGSRALVRVTDTGIGMTPETLARLFEPFTQAEAALDRSQGGLGLGLALVKGIVDLHGGQVTASSDGPGEGSTLAITLPLVSRRAEPAEPRAPVPHRRRRVLVVEDHVDAAETLGEALELLGHEVGIALDGPEGVARARELRPDVVLCDLGLPGLSGFEVARTLRADPELCDVALVAMSGYALPEDVQAALEAGFDRHLAKPTTLEALVAVLDELPR